MFMKHDSLSLLVRWPLHTPLLQWRLWECQTVQFFHWQHYIKTHLLSYKWFALHWLKSYIMIKKFMLWININSEHLESVGIFFNFQLINLKWYIQENPYLYSHRRKSSHGTRWPFSRKFIVCIRWCKNCLFWWKIARNCFSYCTRGDFHLHFF